MRHNPTPARLFLFLSIILISLKLLCVCPLCGGVATVAAAARDSGTEHTKTGIDVLEAEGFAPLKGKRVGLITNYTGVDSEGRRTIDVLAHAPGVKLVALFSPEHGMAGKMDETVANSTDPATGLPIYSLYGETRRPTAAMFANLDALVYDIQDAGVRFYTYVTTMGYCMEQAAKQHIEFFVLDRPDIMGGDVIEGPMLDPDKLSFVAYFPLPVRFAMTLGELARMFNAENKIGADLHVVAMQNWHRSETYDETGLAWIAPSPNLRTLRASFLYPGIEILQAGGVSVGRGTDAPFERFGAPWIHGEELVRELNRRKIPGLKVEAAEFTPDSALYKGERCEGVHLTVTNRKAFRSMLMGLEIVEALQKLYPQNFQTAKIIELLGSQSTVEQLEHGDDPRAIEAGWSAGLEKFETMRRKYLLYH
ncbi:MAG TPA: DUF1343 domain-containing protein [Candidatus Limnocylindrales bacterium]|nr:DUF1343 domain-containing protein [Candidatus Limnocylindrales bacterium]